MSLRQRGQIDVAPTEWQIDVAPTESYTSTAGGSAEMYLSLFFFCLWCIYYDIFIGGVEAYSKRWVIVYISTCMFIHLLIPAKQKKPV